MEHSHIFPAFSPNESIWSLGQPSSEVAQGCPLGPLPVIYYSVLLCLGLPGNWCVFVNIYVQILLCVHLIRFVITGCIGEFAGVRLCILICCAFVCRFECVCGCGRVCGCVSCTAAWECQSLQTHCWFVIYDLVAIACAHVTTLYAYVCACVSLFDVCFYISLFKWNIFKQHLKKRGKTTAVWAEHRCIWLFTHDSWNCTFLVLICIVVTEASCAWQMMWIKTHTWPLGQVCVTWLSLMTWINFFRVAS